MGKLFSGGLMLLCRAGHNGDHIQVGRIDVHFFGIIAFDDRSGHFVGRFAGGKVGNKFREEFFAVGDPSGAAGGNHRQYAAVLDAVDQLGALLHNGKVRAEIGIEYLVKAQAAHGGHHFAGNAGADGQAKFLAQGGADGGRGLNADDLFRIGQGGPYFIDFALFMQRAYGAGFNALAAVHTGAVRQGFAEGRAYRGVKAAFGHADGADLLYILADGDAAAAMDALGVVAHDGG